MIEAGRLPASMIWRLNRLPAGFACRLRIHVLEDFPIRGINCPLTYTELVITFGYANVMPVLC
jgi:hypothetical protein